MVHGNTRSSLDWVGNTQSISAAALVLACVVVEGAPTVKPGSVLVLVGVRVYD